MPRVALLAGFRCGLVVARSFSFTCRSSRRFVSTSHGASASAPTMPQPLAARPGGVLRVVNDIHKSPEDSREYRGLILENEMRVLLISDPATDKSAASLTVNVGHLSDPDELPGLAHFCEHMLFMGTEKYPEENEYSKFLSAHGGGSNAYTSTDQTNYFFDVLPPHFQGALDRFAQFFIEPLFMESSTEREVKAVDSENANNLQHDAWRLIQLERSLSSPTHAYSKYGTGNHVTLMDEPKAKGIDTRAALLQFHKEHYSANRMGLCLLGKESLDELQDVAISLFSPVENKKLSELKWSDHPYGPKEVKRRVDVVPVKDLRGVHASFPIPDLRPFYKSNPANYLSHLIGHEGKGSLLSELKARGWSNSLSAGPRNSARGFAFFGIDIDLSESGEEHIDDVLRLLFDYISMLRRVGPQEWIHREAQELAELTFRFKDKQNPQQYAMTLSTLLHTYPMEEVLSAPYHATEYKPELIQSVLDDLTPDNLVVTVASRKFAGKTTLTEKWYGTEYNIGPLPADLDGKRENPAFSLPAPNPFIPTKFDLYCADRPTPSDPWAEQPRLIADEPLCRLWFLQDAEFRLPKANIALQLSSPVTYADPLSHNLANMFATCLQDALTEFAYDAELAGSAYDLTPNRYGMQLAVRGYDEKQGILLAKIVEKMSTFQPDPHRFEVLKEAYVRNLRNFKMEQPYQHAVYYTSLLLSERVWSKEELLEVADGITVENLREFIPKFLSGLHIEAFVHGNATEQIAKDLVHSVHETIAKSQPLKPLFASQLRRAREVKLPEGEAYEFSVENEVHSNSAVELYLQCGPQETRANMLLELLAQILHEPAFDVLRTKEQLGYIVFSGLRRSNGTQGLRVIVQSAKGPAEVEARVEVFLEEFRKELESMSEEDFQKHKDSLASKRLERPKKLRDLTGKFWSEIKDQVYHFNRDRDEVANLKKILKSDVIDFYDSLIVSKAIDRKKLSVHVEGQGCKSEAGDAPVTTGSKRITEVNAFKESLPLYQLPPRILPLPEPGAKAKL